MHRKLIWTANPWKSPPHQRISWFMDINFQVVCLMQLMSSWRNCPNRFNFSYFVWFMSLIMSNLNCDVMVFVGKCWDIISCLLKTILTIIRHILKVYRFRSMLNLQQAKYNQINNLFPFSDGEKGVQNNIHWHPLQTNWLYGLPEDPNRGHRGPLGRLLPRCNGTLQVIISLKLGHCRETLDPLL